MTTAIYAHITNAMRTQELARLLGAEGKQERLPEHAADLVGRKVDLIVTISPPSA